MLVKNFQTEGEEYFSSADGIEYYNELEDLDKDYSITFTINQKDIQYFDNIKDVVIVQKYLEYKNINCSIVSVGVSKNISCKYCLGTIYIKKFYINEITVYELLVKCVATYGNVIGVYLYGEGICGNYSRYKPTKK